MPLMSMLRLSKSYGGFEIFHELSGRIGFNERVALVGANGTGKSTLLRIIAGSEQPDSGKVAVARSRRIGYLAQDGTLDPDLSLWQAMRAVFAELDEMAAQMRELEASMAGLSGAELDTVLERYASLAYTFEARGGYAYRTRIEQALTGLGFEVSEWDMLCGQLSGGQRTRAALARLILAAPDLLLLDEPTNLLDLNARAWLEGELLRWPGSLLVVSHDRYFLDRIPQRIWELDWGKLETYTGKYSDYVQQRSERHARQQIEYEAQQKEIARTEEFIRRYRAGQRAAEARGRAKRLLRLERVERPREHKRLSLRLTSSGGGGDVVMDSPGMLVGFPARPLVRVPRFEIRRGDRIALIGPNGAGKTTFLRTVVGDLNALQGKFRRGGSVKLGYYAQGHEHLDPELTVLDEMLRGEKVANVERVRTLMGRYLFSGDDIYKRIGDLSGGERSRVALAKLAQLRANLLVLDEPTNHLDILAQEELEELLGEVEATLLFVSHDRYFIDRLATQVWSVETSKGDEPATIRMVHGGYSDYVRTRGEVLSARPVDAAPPAATGADSDETATSSGRLRRRPSMTRQRVSRRRAG